MRSMNKFKLLPNDKGLADCEPLKNKLYSLQAGMYNLNANPNTGKGYISAKIANHNMSIGKTTIILVPFVALAMSLFSEFKKQNIPEDKMSLAGGGSRADWTKPIVISVYDSYEKNHTEFDYYIVDEHQCTYEDSSYRDVMRRLYPVLKEKAKRCPVVGTSATFKSSIMPWGENIIVESIHRVMPDAVIRPDNKNYHMAAIIDAAIKAKTEGKMIYVMKNNKKHLEVLSKALIEHGIDTAVYHSDNKNSLENKKMLDDQWCHATVLLATKSLQAGISLLNDNLQEQFIFIDSGATPESITQAVYRFRKMTSPKTSLMVNIAIDNEESLERFIKSMNRKDVEYMAAEIDAATLWLASQADFIKTKVKEGITVFPQMLVEKLNQSYDTNFTVESFIDGSWDREEYMAAQKEGIRAYYYSNNLGALFGSLFFDVKVSDDFIITDNAIKVVNRMLEIQKQTNKERKETYRKTVEAFLVNNSLAAVTGDKVLLQGEKDAIEYWKCLDKYQLALYQRKWLWQNNIDTMNKVKTYGAFLIKNPLMVNSVIKTFDIDLLKGKYPGERPNGYRGYSFSDLIEHWATELKDNTSTVVFGKFILDAAPIHQKAMFELFYKVKSKLMTIDGKRVKCQEVYGRTSFEVPTLVQAVQDTRGSGHRFKKAA